MPEIEIAESITLQTGLDTNIQSLQKTIKHAVTKYRIRLDCFDAVSVSGRLKTNSNFAWKTKREISQLPLSTTGRKFSDLFVNEENGRQK